MQHIPAGQCGFLLVRQTIARCTAHCLHLLQGSHLHLQTWTFGISEMAHKTYMYTGDDVSARTIPHIQTYILESSGSTPLVQAETGNGDMLKLQWSLSKIVDPNACFLFLKPGIPCRGACACLVHRRVCGALKVDLME